MNRTAMIDSLSSRPSPPTWPSWRSAPSCSCSVVTTPSVTARELTQPRRSDTVLAIRSTPSYSDIAYELSRVPGTSPDPW